MAWGCSRNSKAAYGTLPINIKRKLEKLVLADSWFAVYAEGDSEAADVAMRFVQQQSSLRQVAHYFAEKVEQKIYPSPIHKIGSALDIYEPSIPTDYLRAMVVRPIRNPTAIRVTS